MTTYLSEQAAAEVLALVERSGKGLISRKFMSETIEDMPGLYPILSGYPAYTRLQIITKVMNPRFDQLNKTGKNPASRVWVINQTGVPCVTC